jgi:hypothetical protein
LDQNLWKLDKSATMKPYFLIFIIFLAMMVVTCEENEINTEYQFEAKVLGMNSDCGFYAIQITKGIQQANEIAGTLYTEYTFIASNLPAKLQVEGLSIILNIRRIKDTEYGACTAIGVSYPWIYVQEAKEKE